MNKVYNILSMGYNFRLCDLKSLLMICNSKAHVCCYKTFMSNANNFCKFIRLCFVFFRLGFFLLLYMNHILNPQKCGKLFCATTRLVVFVDVVCSFVFCTWIHLCGSFTQMPYGMLVVFLFVELQLVGIVIRGVS